MIKLNLIAPAYKQMVKKDHLLSSVKNLFLYITLFTIISSIVLLTAKKILTNNFIQAVQRTIIFRTQKDSQKIIQINKKIKLAKNVQTDYIPWSRLLINLSQLIPNNVVINSLSIMQEQDKNSWKINITGIASNRDTLLTLKENLSKTDNLFEDVEVPLTSLFEKENINFNINLKIKKEVLVNLQLE